MNRHATRELGGYLIANVPGWALAGLLAWGGVRWFDLSAAVGAALVAAWVVKDLVLYPSMRRFYRGEPAAERIVGEAGVALTSLEPAGWVRVRGEIWQARTEDGEEPIGEGQALRVRAIHGMLLVVGRDAARRVL
jgi:membrane-bound ClpP family serine protease